MDIGHQKIVKEATLNFSLDELWTLWTTSKGLQQFLGEENNIEMTIGGPFEIYFLLDEPYGTRGSEGCKILSFVPKQQLTFSWNAPPKFPEIRSSDHHTWVVVDFSALNKDQTQIVLTHAGWPKDGSWLSVYEYFDHAWDIVISNLNELQK